MSTERTDIPPAEPLPGLLAIERVDKLITHLKAIKENARLAQPVGTETGPIYLVDPVAIDGWLAWSIAAADVLAAELRGDAPDPGGEHGGPAD
jgi:hypothetical protein